jgi:hypothetical protein
MKLWRTRQIGLCSKEIEAFSKSEHAGIVKGGGSMVQKPSEKEEEYFLRLELERKKECEKEIQEKATEVEKNKGKELHYMKCPKCGMQLIEVDYKGIKIDKCSACQGIWLDAGELEALSRLGRSFLDELFALFLKKD